MMKKLTAFTLAETLIVMGIIGVVAALTIPSLTNSTNNKDVVAKVRKNHAAFEDAWGRMIAKHGELEDWSETLTGNTLGHRLTSSMKLTKECATDACMVTNTKASGEGGAADQAPEYSAILADGTAIGVKVFDANCTKDVGSTQALKKACGSLIIDIDGAKGKATHGYDLYDFWITPSGIYPLGSESDSKVPFTTVANCKAAGGMGCTAWVVYNGNMDYRNAGDDHKCKNNASITLNWTKGNTSCD